MTKEKLLAEFKPLMDGLLPEHIRECRRVSIGTLRLAVAMIEAYGSVKNPKKIEKDGAIIPYFLNVPIRSSGISQPLPVKILMLVVAKLEEVDPAKLVDIDLDKWL